VITTRPRLFAAAIAPLLLAVAGCSGTARHGGGRVPGTSLKIYSSQPLTGVFGAQGRDVVRGEKLALEQAHARVGRFRIDYQPLDDSDPTTGRWAPAMVAANAHQGAKDPRTIAYLGESETGASAVAIPILNEPGILDVSPTDTVSGFTRRRGANPGEPEKYYPTRDRDFARLVPPDDVQAAALVSYMQDEHVRRLFIANDEALYGRTLALTLQRAAQRAGISVVANHGAEIGDVDPIALATDVASSGADAFIYAGAADPRVDEVYRQVAGGVPKAKLFAPNALADDSFVPDLDPSVAPRMFLVSPVLAPRSYPPAARRFVRDFRARYGIAPQGYAVYGYEAMRTVLDAIRAAGDRGNDRGAVIDALYRLGPRPTALGTISIDRQGDVSTRVYGAYRVRADKLVFVRVLDPSGA
jgi:branched-chain amino acid transport system substrate-binding protein